MSIDGGVGFGFRYAVHLQLGDRGFHRLQRVGHRFDDLEQASQRPNSVFSGSSFWAWRRQRSGSGTRAPLRRPRRRPRTVTAPASTGRPRCPSRRTRPGPGRAGSRGRRARGSCRSGWTAASITRSIASRLRRRSPPAAAGRGRARPPRRTGRRWARSRPRRSAPGWSGRWCRRWRRRRRSGTSSRARCRARW